LYKTRSINLCRACGAENRHHYHFCRWCYWFGVWRRWRCMSFDSAVVLAVLSCTNFNNPHYGLLATMPLVSAIGLISLALV